MTLQIDIQKPQDDTIQEYLRFYCQTSEHDDPSLDFMVNMWSFSVAKGDLYGNPLHTAIKFLNHRLKKYKIPQLDVSDFEYPEESYE